MFPHLKYPWTKHFPAGIVRSYFSEQYDVLNITDGLQPEAIDYEIRHENDGNSTAVLIS